jgi:hypothetical protein
MTSQSPSESADTVTQPDALAIRGYLVPHLPKTRQDIVGVLKVSGLIAVLGAIGGAAYGDANPLNAPVVDKILFCVKLSGGFIPVGAFIGLIQPTRGGLRSTVYWIVPGGMCGAGVVIGFTIFWLISWLAAQLVPENTQWVAGLIGGLIAGAFAGAVFRWADPGFLWRLVEPDSRHRYVHWRG